MAARPDPKLYQLMADRVTDYAIFLLDTSGTIMSWNAGAAAIKKYAASEVIGRHFSIFYTDEDIARGWPAHALERATTEGRFEDEGWRVRKDGAKFWANVIITALKDDDGVLLAYSKITRDLTERKKAEESLRQSEERFRLLVEGVQDYAIYLLSPEGIITSWNHGARRIKGYRAGEIIGRHFSQFYASGDIERGKPQAELAVAREHGRAEDEGWRVRKDGSRFWARVVLTALHDAEGRLHGFAKVTQDLTQRRHSEALETAVTNVNDFIAVLAHELRNPLAPIRNAVQLQKISAPGDPAHEMARQIVERQSSQLSRIVDDLLDTSRVTRGTMTIERQPTDLRALVNRAIETARPAMEALHHTLEVDLPQEALQVDGDELRLNQAITNILNNAARYMDPGGRISVKGSVAEMEGRRSVAITVRDTGRGIDPGMLKAIFGMFVQGKDALSRPATGLGVGLALARSIVELHHGTLEVASEGLGKGAEFTIRLPVLERIPGAEQVEAPDVAEASAQAAAACRVLVIDDNVDAAVMLAALLTHHGHKALAAHEGEDAIRLFGEHRPGVVLLDIGMPGMNGLEIAKRLRQMNGSPRPFIVAVTGWGKADDEQRSRDAGFDLHLVKPVEEHRLLKILRERTQCGA